MPRPYNDAVMTAAGAALLDKVRAGLAAIEFTRMVTGDGTYTAEEKISSALRECAGLKSSRNSYALSSVSTVSGGGVKLTALFTDQDPVTGEVLVTEGYYINEIGLYAKEKDADDSTEVLYSITVAAGDIGDYMPAYTGGAPVQIVQEYRARVSDTTAVSIQSAGAAMLAEDAEERFSAIEEMIAGASGGPIGDETLTFEEAKERENIASGETLGTMLGKIKKFLKDLKKVAFTGSYNDLIDTPDTSAGVPEGLESGYVRTGQKVDTTIGDKATAEGSGTTASGDASHAEGWNTIASGEYSHAEGKVTEARGTHTHAEGCETVAGGNCSHAEGRGSTTTEGNAHAEGYRTTASGRNSHAEGSGTTASSECSHAEGKDLVASGYCAHAEGWDTHAEGQCAHTEGIRTKATQSYAHAEGYETTASGFVSHAGGMCTIARNYVQTAIGICNIDPGGTYDLPGSLFIVGNGTTSARSNAFRVDNYGAVFGKKAYQSSGADYAEYFEMLDGNPDDEDLRGYFVTLSGDKIRKASSDDGYILGVISSYPVVVGNSDPDNWHGRFLRDRFGCYITEPCVESVPVGIDEDGKTIFSSTETQNYVLDPEFDETRDHDYIPREQRPEWQPVGMLGQLIVRDDGTCKIDGYCKVADGGIATAGEDGWRVIERIDKDLIRIIFR